jgi:hypothetical protein
VNCHVDCAARDVAASYTDTPTSRDPLVAAAYARLVTASDQLVRHLTSSDRSDWGAHRVHHVPSALCQRSGAHHLGPARPCSRSPPWPPSTTDTSRDGRRPDGAYDRFRGVHDVSGHARLQLGFDRDSEFAAWRFQERFHSPLARRAHAAELHGQHSVPLDHR